jgi:hypothetical protein
MVSWGLACDLRSRGGQLEHVWEKAKPSPWMSMTCTVRAHRHQCTRMVRCERAGHRVPRSSVIHHVSPGQGTPRVATMCILPPVLHG